MRRLIHIDIWSEPRNLPAVHVTVEDSDLTNVWVFTVGELPQDIQAQLLDVTEVAGVWRVMRVLPDVETGKFLRRNYRSFHSMPESIRVAIGMLAMCENQGSIPTIGQKVDATAYWLIASPEMVHSVFPKEV